MEIFHQKISLQQHIPASNYYFLYQIDEYHLKLNGKNERNRKFLSNIHLVFKCKETHSL